MTRLPNSARNRAFRRTSTALAALAGGMLLCAAPAQADSASSARQVVRAMADYMASQKDLAGQFDVELDVITPELEKIRFSSSGSLVLERPDKVHLVRKGGYSEMELVADGKTVTVADLGSGAYAQIKSPGTVDNIIETLRSDYDFILPGADLLLTNSFDELLAGVIEVKHIGVGIVDGVECEHLAFRNAETDAQLWVRSGPRPLPCKYVISSKTMAGAPEYSIRFHDWTSGQAPPAAAFAFKPSKTARMVAFKQMTDIGELPAPAPATSGGR
jgi:hypothetical protein